MWPSWAALRGWVARHRTKLIVAGVLLGTGLYLYRRWQGAVGQFRKLQERMERLSSVQNLYARDQSIALDVALASQATLRDLVIKLVEVPNAAQIRSAMQSTNPQEKVAMWERVKDRSFTQVLTALLAFPLYALFQRVQLTLLSRHAARAAPAATPPPPAQGVLAGLLTRGSAARGADESALTEADKHAFLSQCAFFLATGLPRLVALVEARMRDRIAALPLQQTLDGPAVRALLASLTTQALQELGSPLALLYDAAAPAAAAAASPALAAITAATKAELQSAAFASAYRALVTQLSLRLADRLAAAATPAAAPLVRLLHAVGKLTDALLPAEAAAARTVAEEVHHAPAAEEYMRRLFGVFDELEASLLSGLA